MRKAKAHARPILDLCAASLTDLCAHFGGKDSGRGCLAYRDNGAKVLGVAHLDTVADYRTPKPAKGKQRRKGTKVLPPTSPRLRPGGIVESIALDDRLGVYVLTDLLPALGVKLDWLLTDREECGASTARDFDPPKEYNWVVGFDRMGLDVVMYQYDDPSWEKDLAAVGMALTFGSYSDIADLGHLGVVGFNWGVGYQRQHTDSCYAYLDDVTKSAQAFAKFFKRFGRDRLPWDAGEYAWGYEDDCEVCDGCFDLFAAEDLRFDGRGFLCHDCAEELGVPWDLLTPLPEMLSDLRWV